MRRAFLLTTLLILSFASFAQSISLRAIAEDSLLAYASLSYYEDSSSNLNFKEVQSKSFIPGKEKYYGIKNTESAYWMKFNLEKDSLRKFVLEVITPQTEELEIYIPQLDGTYRREKTGYLHPFVERSYLHKNFVFDIDVNTNYRLPFYARIKSSNKVAFLLKLRTQKDFTAYSLKEYILLGIYYGVLILLALYNIILFFSIRKIVYLFYSLTVIVAALISSSDDGLGFAFLWSNHPTWSQNLGLYILPLLFLLFYTMYSYFFLESRLQRYRKIILITSSAYVLYFVLQLFVSSEKFYFSQLYIIPFVCIYVVYWICWKGEKFEAAKFFIAGNTFALLGITINQLRLLEILPGNVFTVYSFDVGILLEFISLSLSLGYLYNLQIRENEKVQKDLIVAQDEKIAAINEKNILAEKVNKELENKVQERTAELKVANDKLADLVRKLDGMNLDYDKENWNLRTKVRDEKRSLLFNDTLTFKEIKELYPTTEACLLYLSQLKWKEEVWRCDCFNTKYSVNDKNYSRKCSRCGKIHSVTAGSIFHAQKLPLPSLFYVAHLVNKGTDVDVQKLSEELDISANSLYKFIKKIRERKEERGGDNWDSWVY